MTPRLGTVPPAQPSLPAMRWLPGRHFDLAYSSPEDVGWRAMVSCQSDIAAMGFLPAYSTVTVGLTGEGASRNGRAHVRRHGAGLLALRRENRRGRRGEIGRSIHIRCHDWGRSVSRHRHCDAAHDSLSGPGGRRDSRHRPGRRLRRRARGFERRVRTRGDPMRRRLSGLTCDHGLGS